MTRLYLLPSLGFRKDLKKYGAWAVVTGATDGIGKAIAKQLAKRGMNVVLISRSEDKLNAVAEEFGAYKVEIRTITYDFNDVKSYDIIEEQLKDLDIGVLVNNVGVGYDHPDYFLELTDEFCDRLINVNITSISKMTRIVLKGMVERKRGLIVHVSSESGLKPVPLLSLYSAGKSFVEFFSNCLQSEYSGSSRVYNQVLCPSFVSTKLSKVRAGGVMIPSADRFAASAVNAFGLAPTLAGWWAHDVKNYIVETFIPDALFNYIALSMMQSGRKRWIKKQQQKKE